MNRQLLASVAAIAAVSAMLPATAQAQSYYARERISTVRSSTSSPTPTPTPAASAAAWVPGAWGAWSSQCSEAATRTRSVTCMQDGATVADSLCAAAGARPASSETHSNLASCSYFWDTGGYGGPSSTCSAAAVSTRAVSCVRAPSTQVADSFCDAATRPASTMTNPTFSGCQYTPTYGAGQGQCTASSEGSPTGTRVTQLIGCQRSDGTDVTAANAAAGNPYCTAPTSTEACPMTYTPTYGSYGNCTPNSSGSTIGTRSASVTSCVDQNGRSTALGACAPATQTQACTPTYTPAYGSYGACTNGEQFAPVVSCTSDGGIAAPLSACDQTARRATCSSDLRSCGSFSSNYSLPVRNDMQFFAASLSGLTADDLAMVKDICQKATRGFTIAWCGTTPLGTGSCTSAGVAVPAGKRCYGASVGPAQTPASNGDANYKVASCTPR